MIDFWIFPLSTIWGAYQNQGFQIPLFIQCVVKPLASAMGI